METYNESNCYIEPLIKQKIQLKNKNKTTEFIIDIYLHQDNNYYILTNILENPVYSLDTIFISKKEELIPKKLTFENYDLFSDDYGLNNMRRICLINIEKNSLINFINSSSRQKLTGGEQIFEHKYHDLLLNIRIQEGDSFNSSLFINQKPGEIYDFTPQEIDILNRFDSNVIDNYLNKYKNFETDSITEEMETSFKRDVKKFISLNFYDEENNIENNKFVLESIPLLSEEDEKEDIMLDINEPKKMEKNIKFNFPLNIENNELLNNINSSAKVKKLLDKFFESPIEKRYSSEPGLKDLKICEILCNLMLSISAKTPLKSIISFYSYKKRILKEAKDFSMKEKIKIVFCIKSHLEKKIPLNIKLQKMFELPEYSPYIQGEIMYRNIVKNLTEKSKLKFTFLQLNSGGGYDFIQKDNCYLFKMIPLIVIKSHLLYILEDYFFSYSNGLSSEFAFTDPYTNIVSINEDILFNCKDDSSEEDEDNSIKIGLLNFHEKGGHKKFGQNEKSPRSLISDELDVYDNYNIESNGGESGNALEINLLGNNYINKLMGCDGLKNLADYELFIGEDGKKLLSEIENILKKNNENYGIETIDKKSINNTISNYNTGIDALKYRELKTYGFNDKLNIKLKNRFNIINNNINNYNSKYN
jgi:hypothetical protein